MNGGKRNARGEAPRPVIGGLAIGALLLQLVGCGTMTSAPDPSGPGAGTGLTTGALPVPTEDGGCAGSSLQHDEGTIPLSQIVTVPATLTGHAVTTILKIQNCLGGTITAGRFTMIIPFGALARDTQIVLSDISGVKGFLACRVEPRSMILRHPVTLMVDVSGAGNPEEMMIFGTDLEVGSDPPTRPLGALLGPDGQTLLGLIDDTGIDYLPGKAGW